MRTIPHSSHALGVREQNMPGMGPRRFVFCRTCLCSREGLADACTETNKEVRSRSLGGSEVRGVPVERYL